MVLRLLGPGECRSVPVKPPAGCPGTVGGLLPGLRRRSGDAIAGDDRGHCLAEAITNAVGVLVPDMRGDREHVGGPSADEREWYVYVRVVALEPLDDGTRLGSAGTGAKNTGNRLEHDHQLCVVATDHGGVGLEDLL